MPASPQTPKNTSSQKNASARLSSGNEHVLDLRSIVAQREARRAKKQQTEDMPYSTPIKKRRKKSSRRATTIQKIAPVQKVQKRKRTPKKVSPKNTSSQPSIRTLIVSLVICAIGLFLFLLPALVGIVMSSVHTIQERVTVHAQAGADRLQEAVQLTTDAQSTAARTAFLQAQESFSFAIEQTNGFDFLIPMLSVFPGRSEKVVSGWHLLHAGNELAMAGEQITKAMEEFDATDIESIARNENVGLTRLLLIAHATVAPTQQHVATAAEHLSAVSVDAVPAQQQETVARAQELLPDVNAQLADATKMIELLLALLGHDTQKRYAVIFANNHELRAGMGFPGALAFVDVRNGVVTNIDIPGGGIYDVSGQLTEKVISPKPLHLVNPQWTLQDSLWFPHFPASAQKFQWFLERSSAPSVDGVIAFTPSVIEELLAITGPIDLTEKYGLRIDEKNFYREVQMLAEEKYDTTTKSKQIIADMTPLLFNKLFSAGNDPEQLRSVMTVLQQALKEKNVVLYMNDPLLQESISQFDWGGEMKTSEHDYLAVIQDNIAGGKTNSVIEDTVRHRVDIANDGSIVDTVTLTLNHTGTPTDPLTGLKYTTFVRFYVPQGSELLSADGFDTPDAGLFLTPEEDAGIDPDLQRISGDVLVNELTQVYSNTEFGKQVFGGWMQIEPGTGASVTVTYKLPFQLKNQDAFDAIDSYSLLVQKQLGSFGTIFSSQIHLPENMHATRSYPEGFSGVSETLLDEDYFSGLIIERK